MRLKTLKPPQRQVSPKKEELVCSEGELEALAKTLAPTLKQGDRVFLEGEMGTGKTTFARYLLSALGVARAAEGSPTFPIAHEYHSPKGEVIHLDLYRIKDEKEAEQAGVPSYFWDRSAIVLVEWMSQLPELEQQLLKELNTGRARILKIEFRFPLDQDPEQFRKVLYSWLKPHVL